MENSLNTIQQLVANFKSNEAAYLASNYSESQVRQDFIDKFFTALGWDVTHTKQFNPYAQEVKIENRVTMPGTQRRADYAFSIAPNFDQIKFFVEAKKPSRSLANADDYFQTIRYAWNTKIPIAVLTDFEEFHILDCRYKPNIKTALERRIGEYRYTDYADKEIFAKIFHLFGREAVAAGSLEKYAAGLPKKGTKQVGGIQPVDDAFLEELDEYREILAKAFKKTNEALQGDELTEAVQRTIDRLVFIRFLEDKGIEDKQIISIEDPKTAWKSFVTICKRFEPKYNGLVFKSHRILDSGEFHSPDGAAFATICQKISDPSSPYDFNFIPISILGSIYERFLGKVVHATEKRVKVEEKPEVRKAGGVYYTPEYIVRYIVKETVGKLIEGKKPEQIALMAFADIACGSGSFLIEVYAQVLEYHLQYYMNHPESVGKDVLFERDGKKYLTLKKKKEILTNNVYGVDIDFQATEVTQLSLYLKMLENATMNDAHQFVLFRETILPDLRQNIICGNSLIGRDILEGDLFSSVDESKLKPMNYEDAFPIILKRGGFDAIVGNPPYVRPHNLEDNVKEYFWKHYRTFVKKSDLYCCFIEKAIKSVRLHGLVSYIVSDGWLRLDSFEELRIFMLSNCIIKELVELPEKVFAEATVKTGIFITQKNISEIKYNDINIVSFDEQGNKFVFVKSIKQQYFNDTYKNIFDTSLFGDIKKLKDKIVSNSLTLGSLLNIQFGLKTGDDTKFISNKSETKDHKPLLRGENVQRYSYKYVGEYVWYVPDKMKLHRKTARPGDKNRFEQTKILIKDTSTKLSGTIDYNNYYVKDVLVLTKKPNISLNLEFILGVMNSKMMRYYYETSFPTLHVQNDELSSLPFRSLELMNPIDKTIHDKIVKLVNQILESKQKLSAAKTDGEINRLDLLCASIDRKIDEAVYELYGLTEDEIKIVKGEN